MSIYYEVYLEALIDNNWRCISPQFPTFPENQKNTEKRGKFAPIYSNGSSFRTVINSVDNWTANYDVISKDLLNDLFTENEIKEFENEDAGFFSIKPVFCIVDSRVLGEIIEDAKKKTDRTGYVTREEADIIDKGEWNEDIYPADMEEIINNITDGLENNSKEAIAVTKELVPVLFDKFYVRREWLEDGGLLYYKKVLAEKVTFILDMINDLYNLYMDDAIIPEKCRLVIYEC